MCHESLLARGAVLHYRIARAPATRATTPLVYWTPASAATLERPAFTEMSDTPWALFRFCPRCGAPRTAATGGPEPFGCQSCGFVYFFNPAIAVAALIVRPDGLALFIRRASDPARGRLALVGGFVDPGENAEGALEREVREEVGLEIEALTFLSSSPNDYHYRGTTYPVVDLIFAGTTRESEARALDGVASLEWLDPFDVPIDELAFRSMRDGVARYREIARR